MKLLKSALKFWQEIVFMIPVGILMTIFLVDVLNGRFIDGLGIAIICFHAVLFVCLVGQFFWKNGTLALCLTPLLVLYSLFWIFVSYAMPRYIDYNVPNPNNYLRPVLLISALFLIFAAITMSKKFYPNENNENALNT